ncbi:hypothetical protein GCM10022226_50330 [Sphaerisporangium flaviroseum]|uniref:3'-phosphate/5'-hydroxy nucleic acid ligase n=1 Tax=Sphaerisporangium flaviroseum TaxID=509199 RepID=A0ABP7IPH3_9ACTN
MRVSELPRYAPVRSQPRTPHRAECRKDAGVLDEIPGAYKDLESVMAAQTDLVEVVAHLRQIICIKG